MLLRSRSLLGDDPDGVDDAGEVAEEGEDEADPELDLQRQQFGPTLVDQPPRNNARTRTLAGCRWTMLLTPQPNLKKTPSGGRMMARTMSMQVAVPSDILLLA